MQYVQIDQMDWKENSEQSIESLKSILSLKTVNVCILWKDSIIAERKVKQWIFPYLQKNQQNPSTVTEVMQFLADSSARLRDRLAGR